jgi:2-(1,2-epoxy-1,2-dihydrophenyl)acetyl-CoA isomerase
MNYQQITVDRDRAVAKITLNRPDKLNALTQVMSDELVDAFTTAGEDDGVRAVLLTGAGRGFCAGQDLSEFRDATGEAGPRDIKEHLRHAYHKLIPIMVETPKPVVCAVNGVAAGAGLSLAVACDVRIASEAGRFTQAFVKIGLVPDSGGTWLLSRVVGPAKALELSITGDMLDADAALRIGLVSRVVAADALEKESLDYAATLAAMPTAAIGEAKALFRSAPAASLQEALDAEADAQQRMGSTHDFSEGVTAFSEKREPRFEGR